MPLNRLLEHHKSLFSAFILVLSLIFTSHSHANVPAPDDIIKTATHDMISSINTNRAEIRKNPDKIKSLVEQIIMPHLDFIAASKWVMGKYWRRADKTQKISFIRQFRTLLLRFYSSALAEYMNDKDKDLRLDLIHYFPMKTHNGDEDITIRGEVRPDTGQPIPLLYRMHKTHKGWKIYDVSVEGVSMITTYKNNFATELKQKGIDGLIASLEEKNKNLLANNTKASDKKKAKPQ